MERSENRGSRSARRRSGARGVRTRGGSRGMSRGPATRLTVAGEVFMGTVRDMPTESSPQEQSRAPKRAKVMRPTVSNETYLECDSSTPDAATASTSSFPPLSPGVSSGESSGSSSGCLSPSARSLLNTKTGIPINYGSEEESDSDDEEDGSQAMMMPRTTRPFLGGEEDEEPQEEADPLLLPPSSPHHCRDAQTSPLVSTPFMPNNKFHFEWRSSSTTQVSANLRRERFSEIKTGPTVSFMTPYEAFTAIWDREIIETIVSETNIYAQQQTAALLDIGAICPQSRITKWRDTTVNEIYTFLAIVLAMGIVVKSRVEEYWNSKKNIFSTPGFSQCMSYNRFTLLSKCLHFNNNLNLNAASFTRPRAKLVKLQPIIDHLNRKFSELYILSRNVVLDESLTEKVATVGIKTYEICDSSTGYLWRFEAHAGPITLASENDNLLSKPIPALVLRLLDGLEGKGHTIWMDYFYNSPALARELKVRGFDCAGTLRTNRQFVPSQLASLSKSDMTVGQVVGCTSGDVDLMVWRDKNLVAFISTYHGAYISRSAGIERPAVANDYNLCMGGIDRKDQTLSMFPVERKCTRVWYKKFFRGLLNVSVLNAYILLNKKTLSHRNFRKELVESLVTAHGTPAPTVPTLVSTQSIQHYPARRDLMAGAQYRQKHFCAHCKKRTTTYCKICNVAMCVYTCFDPYHNSQ